MKILHTSDWHIGNTLYGKRRQNEYEQFFTWLVECINTQKIDILLVAGDVFDTALPSNTAQKIYYKFLWDITKSHCKHIIITAGNHDSATFLTAPKELLKSLNIHIIGEISNSLENEIIRINNNDEEVIVLAVPYLRERDIREAIAGESIEDRTQNIINGIHKHYSDLAKIISDDTAIKIAMGHLFVAGSSLQENDGERDLYIGSLAQITSTIFSKDFDYVALGHIHSAQCIGNNDKIRYSGSPLAMSFSENAHNKKVLVIDTKNACSVEEIAVPAFQQTAKIKGDIEKIEKSIKELIEQNTSIWLEVEYTGEKELPNLKETIQTLVEDSKLEVLKIKNLKRFTNIIKSQNIETLQEETPSTIFALKLENLELSHEQKTLMTHCFQSVLQKIHEQDENE